MVYFLFFPRVGKARYVGTSVLLFLTLLLWAELHRLRWIVGGRRCSVELLVPLGLTAATATFPSQEKYDEADRLYLRCIEIEEKTLGPDHLELAASLHDRADLLRAQVCMTKGCERLTRGGVNCRTGTHKDPYVCTRDVYPVPVVALFWPHQDQFRLLCNDEKVYLALDEWNWSFICLCTGSASSSLCSSHRSFVRQGKLEEAGLLLARAIAIQERALGPDHPSLASTLDDRATLLSAQVFMGAFPGWCTYLHTNTYRSRAWHILRVGRDALTAASIRRKKLCISLPLLFFDWCA